MPRIDWNKYQEASNTYKPIPNGKYKVKVIGVKDDKKTNNGDEMWGLKLEVQEGQYHGRILWDNLVFSESAKNRAKLICSRMGIDVSGISDLTPETVMDRQCIVDVETKKYTGKDKVEREENTITFAGYEAISEPDHAAPVELDSDDITF